MMPYARLELVGKTWTLYGHGCEVVFTAESKPRRASDMKILDPGKDAACRQFDKLMRRTGCRAVISEQEYDERVQDRYCPYLATHGTYCAHHAESA